ncbi:hypothetical protein ACHQM5_020945 [Ranunculus cassubicifolius]
MSILGVFCSSVSKERLLQLYIIGVIIARIWADYFMSNFVDYLAHQNPATKKALYTPAEASAIINAKDALSGICGIIGAILIDVSLTNYGLIFFSSLIYGLGFLCLAFFDGTPQNISVVGMFGLFVSATGNLSLMNSSNNLAKEKRDVNERKTNFFTNIISYGFGDDNNVFRLVQRHGHVIALVFLKYATKLVFIGVTIFLDHVYGINLSDEKKHEDANIQNIKGLIQHCQILIPTFLLLLMALISLVHIKSFKKPLEDRRNPLKHVVRVCIAAFRKRHLKSCQTPTVEVLDEASPEHTLKYTDGLRFLDKAAIIQSTQPEEDLTKRRHCTVTQVEETKRLIRMIPMCMTFLAHGLVKSVGNTFFLIQGMRMDSTISNTKTTQTPIQTLIILGELSGLATKGLYSVLISKKLTGQAKRYGSPLKYVIGVVLATFCCTVASWVASDKGKDDSIAWLIPQFLLFGAMTEVTRDGIEGFFHDQLPPSMIRYDSVFTDAMIGAGAVLSTALVYATQSDLEENKDLSIFYRLLTVVCFVILSLFTFIATRYEYQDNEDKPMIM